MPIANNAWWQQTAIIAFQEGAAAHELAGEASVEAGGETELLAGYELAGEAGVQAGGEAAVSWEQEGEAEIGAGGEAGFDYDLEGEASLEAAGEAAFEWRLAGEAEIGFGGIAAMEALYALLGEASVEAGGTVDVLGSVIPLLLRATDTFTDSNGLPLQDHISDSGHGWTKRGSRDFFIQGDQLVIGS